MFIRERSNVQLPEAAPATSDAVAMSVESYGETN
jgi:hypothetical protein